MLGDESEQVRYAATRVLAKIDLEALQTLSTEAVMILEGKPLESILCSPVQSLFANVIGGMRHSSPELLDALTLLLDWPFWQVRIRVAQAFGALRRSIPDSAIRRLLALRNESDPRMHAVQVIIDDVLAEILSLETGIEDD
jgi:HEAT repeat protein